MSLFDNKTEYVWAGWEYETENGLHMWFGLTNTLAHAVQAT